MAKRALPLWTFWLPIANQRDASGKTAYVEAMDASGKSYGSVVTPPTIYLPEMQWSRALSVRNYYGAARM
jgi:hypothetical protein